jgi:putative chitinase
MTLTAIQLDSIIDRKSYPPKRDDLLKTINLTLGKFDIQTPLRIAMYLAQVIYETDGFKFFTALGSFEYFRQYDGLMGNTEPGDGAESRGRGFIQITGKHNYTLAGKALGLDLAHNPDKSAELDIGARTAGWFWSEHDLNDLADQGDIVAVTKRINGGTNVLEDRIGWYLKTTSVLISATATV